MCVSSCIPASALLQHHACALFDQSTSSHEVLRACRISVGLTTWIHESPSSCYAEEHQQWRLGSYWQLTLASERAIALLNHEDLLALVQHKAAHACLQISLTLLAGWKHAYSGHSDDIS